jgi:hypothetical protein
VLFGLLGCVACGSSGRSDTGNKRAEAGSGGMSGVGGGAAGSGAGGMAGGGMAGMPAAPQWLAYLSPEGNFAYDATTFPATEATKLSAPPTGLFLNGRPPAWSPNGKYVAYFAGDSLAMREMTGRTPGPEVTLATGLTPTSDAGALQWFWDSSAIAVQSGTTLYAVDPTSSKPTLNLITDKTLYRHILAPAGGGLVYRDGDGVNFTRVTAGVPSTPEPVGMIANSLAWSRDGNTLAVNDALEIFLYDVSGPSVERTLVTPIPSLSTYSNPTFNSDGSLFAFNSDEGVIYSTTSAPATTGFIESPVSGTISSSPNWSLTGTTMIFAAVMPPVMQTNQWFYVSFSGSTPSEIKAIPGSWQYAFWLPDRVALIATDFPGGQASYIDLSGATPVITPYPMQSDNVYSVQWAPVGDRLALITRPGVALTSLSDPSAPTQRLTSTQGELDWAGWSSAASYMALLSSSRSYQDRGIEVVRVDGATPSAVVPLLAPAATTSVNFAWQPKTP